jgi:hypothetical protein
MITVHPTEQAAIEALGEVVEKGLLQPHKGQKVCPFDNKGYCGLHNKHERMFGCIASPFTLTKSGTLIIRNRYRMFKCYKADDAIPAYQAFNASLRLIFGEAEATVITSKLDAGSGDFIATITRENFDKLIENDAIKHGGIEPSLGNKPTWVNGDSSNIDILAPGEYDMVFSCPPYGDLEVYSDDPEDLSTI